MSLVITPTYSWTDGDLVTATRLNSTPTIADGQAVAFSTVSASGLITSTVGGNAVVLSTSGATTGYRYIAIGNTGGGISLGVDSSTGGGIITGDTAYDGVITHASGISFSANGGTALHMRLSPTGLAVTGALSATVSTSVKHVIGTGSTPGFTPGTGAGTGPTISITGTDTAGQINLLFGTSPAGTFATIITVNFSTAYASAPFVCLTPVGNTTSSATFGSSTTAGFTIISAVAGVGAGTQLFWNYHVVQ